MQSFLCLSKSGCLSRQLRTLRRYASSGPSKQETPHPKPKATTTLRKAASASIPIREKIAPLRGKIQPVVTLTTAERYVLSRLHPSISKEAKIFAEALWLPNLASVHKSNGEAFIFENGCIVCWGIEEQEVRNFVQKHIGGTSVEVNPYHEVETEEVEFVIDSEEATRLQGDLIILGSTKPLSNPEDVLPSPMPTTVLPEQTVSARYAFSQALARSTALSALENSLEEFLSSVSRLPLALSKTGKPGLPRTEIIKKLGQLLKFRQSINLNPENFADTPELYWSEPVLEKYFAAMSHALEIKSRTHLVNSKITYAVEVQSVLRELLTEASSHRMELIIIALIAVEVVLALIREGPDLWGLLRGKPPKHQG